MADRGVDLSALPKEVRDQLAELDLELSEGKLSIQRVEQFELRRRWMQREVKCGSLACLHINQPQTAVLCQLAESQCCCSGSGHDYNK